MRTPKMRDATNPTTGEGRGAVLSDCEKYRYALWRDTGVLGAEGTVLFVMLNPSTADATEDDPTIRRCIRFATDWGFARLAVGNAYALRATDPKQLRAADDPVGPENDEWLNRLAIEAAEVIGAWGTHIDSERERHIIDLIEFQAGTMRCLGQTKALHPKHPLYLAADTKREVLRRYMEPVS